jgi:hypothetical protein
VVWSGDLPGPLQQILFDAADGITPRAPARIGEHEPAVITYRPRLLAAGRTPPAEPAGAGSARLSNSHRSYAGGGIVPNLIFSAISGLLATSPDAGTCSLSRAPSNL